VELMVEEVTDLDTMDLKQAAGLRIVVNLDRMTEERFEEIREYILDNSGNMPVRFELRRPGQFRARLVPPPALTMDPSPEARDGLVELLAGGRCDFEFDTAKRNGKAAEPQPVASEVETGVVN